MTTKKFLALVMLICVPLSAQAVQTVELKEIPPLEPLRWCQTSDGKVASQAEKCEHGATEVSSIVHFNADGTSYRKKLGATLESSTSNDSGTTNGTGNTATDSATPPASTPVEMTTAEKSGDSVMKDWRKSMLRMLFFAVVFGVVAKVIGRSFLLWFFVGAGVHFMLVVLNVLSV